LGRIIVRRYAAGDELSPNAQEEKEGEREKGKAKGKRGKWMDVTYNQLSRSCYELSSLSPSPRTPLPTAEYG
jgi:hypothetical protein